MPNEIKNIGPGDLARIPSMWMDWGDFEPLLHVIEIDHRIGYANVVVVSGKDMGKCVTVNLARSGMVKV